MLPVFDRLLATVQQKDGFDHIDISDDPPPAPAYLLVQGKVEADKSALFGTYMGKLNALYGKYGGEHISFSRSPLILEGAGSEAAESASGTVLISKWACRDGLLSFLQSKDVEELRSLRNRCGDFTVMVLDGLPKTVMG